MATPELSGPEGEPLKRDPAYESLRSFIWARLGIDLDHYKQPCVQRRLAVRLRARGCASLTEYLGSLSQDDEELRRFLKALTVNVTEFFRNPSSFERIRELCLPRMFSKGGGHGMAEGARRRFHGPVRAWSVGCASGEESYSVAILLREYLSDHPDVRPRSAEIFATDMDVGMIERAKEGLFDEQRIRQVSIARRARWFQKEDGGWRVGRKIRTMVRYEVADAIRHAPDDRQDMIICRNMLIYIARAQQEKLFERFHRVLQDGGFLILGKTELLSGKSRRMFKALCPEERIYQAVA
jgi:chemotaxis protein methyltransferase CheR